MRRVKTECIYTATKEGLLGHRLGAVRLDAAEAIECEDDVMRPLHVSGLRAADIALFLTFGQRVTDPDTWKSYTFGFVVTAFDRGGEVIMAGNMVDAAPEDWSTRHLNRAIRCLQPAEFNQLGLPNLAAYALSKA